MFFILFVYSFLFTSRAFADEAEQKTDWLQLTHNYYWFAIEDYGNMDLFLRAKSYLARHLSTTEAYDTIDCGAILDDNASVEDPSNVNKIAPADSYDILLPILPFLRDPMTAMGFNTPKNVPMEVLKKDSDIHALALDICLQEDIAHDTHGAVFPMSRFLEGSLFQDSRAYGIYEIIDDPSVMATTSASEKLIADIERTMPNESNFAVVITSQPKSLAMENESYYMFNGSERFYNYPFAEQNMSMDTLADSLLEKKTWREQKEILRRLDATSVVWLNILQQETQEGDAFYVHETRVLDHEDRELILKHMGFSLNRTYVFWPAVLTIGLLYLLVACTGVFLYRKNYLAERFNIVFKKNKAPYVQTLIFSSPLLGFFGYLFLASFLMPLQPALDNLWFVSFWWPIFSFCAIFLTPLVAYWPMKSKLADLISYNFDDFFPIFSFLSFFGASLHLICNFFFVYQGWELFGIIFCVLSFILLLSTFVHSRKSYAIPTSIVILLLFSFLSVLRVHVFIYFGAVVLLAGIKVLELIVFRYLEYAEYHAWTEGVWAKESIPEWTQTLRELCLKIQNQKDTQERKVFIVDHEPNAPMLLFFHKLQQKLDKTTAEAEHKFVSITEKDEDMYGFQKKLFGLSQDIGDLLTQGMDEDPIEAQNQVFQNKLSALVDSQTERNVDLFIYIENYDYLSKRTAAQIEAFLTDQSLSSVPSKIFIIGTQVQKNPQAENVVQALTWERIKDISSDYISEEILEWIEKEFKLEEQDGDINTQYMLQKVEYLIWYHNKDVQDTQPGIGDPIDVIRKGLSSHITTKTGAQRSKDDFTKIKKVIGQNATSKSILLYEFFNHSMTEGDVFIRTNNFTSLKEYTQSKSEEKMMVPYTSLSYAIKKLFKIKAKCTIEEVLKTCNEMEGKQESKDIIAEFKAVQESVDSQTDPYDLQSYLTKLFIECITNQDPASIEALFKYTAEYYEKLQNKKAVKQLLQLGEYLYPASDIILDLNARLVIIDIHMKKAKPNRKRAFKDFYDEVKTQPQQKIELRTWDEFFTMFLQGANPLDTSKETATEMSEQELFAALINLYERHAQDPVSLYQNPRSPLYYQYQVEYDQILIGKALKRGATQKETAEFISALEKLLSDIATEIEAQTEKNIKDDLRLVTVHIRNKLYRIMMGTKNLDVDALIEKTVELIKDREELEHEELDYDYALLRDLYQRKGQFDLAFEYALNALSVTIVSMKKAVDDNNILQKNKEVGDVIMTISRLAGLLLQAKDTVHPTLKEYFADRPQVYDDMLDLLLPNRIQEEERWQTLSPKEFILHCCHAICNKESLGAPFFFSVQLSFQGCAYIYLLDQNFALELREKRVINEIIDKLHTENWEPLPFFLTPQGIVKFYQGSIEDDFEILFTDFVDSKRVRS